MAKEDNEKLNDKNLEPVSFDVPIEDGKDKEEIPKEKKKKYKIFNVKKDKIDFKVVNYSILFMSVLAGIVLLIFTFSLVRDMFLAPVSQFAVLLTPFLVGIVIAWLLSPVVEKLQEKRNMSRRKASAIVSIIGITLITVMIVGILYATAETILTFLSGKNLSYFIYNPDEDIALAISNNVTSNSGTTAMKIFIFISEQLGWMVKENNNYVLKLNISNIDQYIGVIGKFVYQYVIIAIVASFILPEFRGLNKTFKGLIPKKYKNQGSDLIDIIATSFTSYMNGALKIAMMVGSFIGGGLIIITILCNTLLSKTVSEGSFYIGSDPMRIITIILIILVFTILAGLTNLIPYAGPFIGGVPIVLLIFLTDGSDGYWVTIAVGCMILLVQFAESLFLQPLIMGRSTKMHPVVILLGLTIFSSWFGLVGLLISTPVIAILKAIISYYDDLYEIF